MSIAETTRGEALGPDERIDLLLDPGTFRGVRSAVGDGVVSGVGRVDGRPLCVWAQDGSFKGGSLGAAGGDTIVRTIDRADSLGVPVVGFPHSGGARMQEGVAALTAYAAIFRAQANARVPMISVIAGACAGGAAYSPSLGDLTVMAGDAAHLFLTGPKIIEQVTRESVTAAELGGPRVHGANGVAHLLASDEAHAAELVRAALGYLPNVAGATNARNGPPLFHRCACTNARKGPGPFLAYGGDPAEPLPASERQVYDVREVARRLVDSGALLELSARWARNLVVGLARIEGRPVGVIANQPKHLGGCLDAAAAEKGAWFVGFCDRFGLPLVVLVDTPGFLPGVTQETAGVLRHGASLLRAFATARVPRVTVTLRQAFGGAHIVMNSRDLGATLTLAWPGARIGVMGARQAVELVRRREIAAGADPEALAAAYTAEHLPVRVAATAGFVDEVIEPAETRERIAFALETAA